MKRSAVIALALTWDGARWPMHSLPPKARAFLAAAGKDLRICWLPRLKGGNDVLSQPFQTPTGRRIQYKAVRTTPFGDILGVVYRRE